MSVYLILLVGLGAGILSGLFGIGGGIVIIPALVFGFGFSQHLAQGTTLVMMVLPIGLMAAWTYYQQGFADLKIALFLGAGFFLGGLVGAKIATGLSNNVLSKVLGVLMLVIAIKMIFSK